MKKALFVVLDGADGTGKDTQAKRLVEQATQRGLRAALFAYPNYATPVGQDIAAYQQGRYGELGSVDPHLVCYPYAVNRFETQAALRQAITTSDLVVASRYVSSNVVYSTARVPARQRLELGRWVEQLDYDILGNPPEDAVIVLDLPTELSSRLIAQRALGRRDINDENRLYRQAVRDEYAKLANERPNWYRIDCAKGDKVRSVESIGDEIATLVLERLLPAHKRAV